MVRAKSDPASLPPGQIERMSLLVRGRRLLTRAKHSPEGCSVVELCTLPGQSGPWLAALIAGSALVGLPCDRVATVQVMQGQIRVHGDDRSILTFPGDFIVGPTAPQRLEAVSDAVVLVSGTTVLLR